MQQQTVPTGFGASVSTPKQLYTQFLSERGFEEADIATLGLKLLDKDATKGLLGHTHEWSVQIPYYDIDGKETGFHRVRLLQPKSKMKYSQARASGSHIYFPLNTNWRKVITDVDIPIIITEGEFKAWAITRDLVKDSLPYACLGLAGVTSWTDKHGLHLHKDLMQIMWRKKTSFESKNRKVYIIFDYDGAKEEGEPNEQVALAETKLAITLRGLGAEVHLCRVGKFGPGSGSKYAIDDHLLAGGNIGEVLTTTSIVMNGVDTLDVKLHEFSTKYALHNGDVIRLHDGHIMSFQKAKIDSAQHIFIQTNTVPGRNGGPPKVIAKEIPMLEEYKKWHKRCDIRQVGVYPQYQGLRITPEGCYNYLNYWSYEPTAGDPTPYLDFCNYFFRDEPTFADYWHNWVANIIQYPYRRNYTTPQFASAIEGIGKSAVSEFIAEMMGLGDGAPAAIVGPDELFGNFNGMLKNKIFVVVNEPSSDRDDHSAKLKNYVTSNEIAINNKYGAQYTVTNYLNFVFTTNKPYVTHMGNTARREAIYSPKTLTNKETHPKVSALFSWARSGGFGIMLNWYYERDLSSFDPRKAAPETGSRKQAIELSKTPMESFANQLRDWVLANVEGVAAFTVAQLNVLCEQWGYGNKLTHQYLHKAMSAIGEIEPSKMIKIEGKAVRHTVFVVTAPGVTDVTKTNYSRVAKDTADALSKEITQNATF
jgi:hypothetical protein